MDDKDMKSVWHYLENDDELYMVWQDALNEMYARDDDVLCAEDWLLGALAHVAESTREQEFGFPTAGMPDRTSRAHATC